MSELRFLGNEDCPLLICCAAEDVIEENGGGCPKDDRTTSRESTPSVQEEKSLQSFFLKEPRSCRRGFVIGSPSRSIRKWLDFGIPMTKKNNFPSRQHCRIYLGQYGTYMIADTSKNGTKVNGELIRRDGKAQAEPMMALNPEECNIIEIGSAKLHIFINENAPKYSVEGISGLPELDELSVGSGSTPAVSETESVETLVPRPKYHILERSDICARGVVKRLIFKANGKCLVGKYYKGSQNLPACYANYKALLDSLENDVRRDLFIAVVDTQISNYGSLVITDYREVLNLEQIMNNSAEDGIDKDNFNAWYFNIMSALKHLDRVSIIHRAISPRVILIDRHSNVALLSGFSESYRGNSAKGLVGDYEYRAPEMERGDEYDIRVDVYSVSKIFRKHLKIDPDQRPDDVTAQLVDQGLEEKPNNRPKPSKAIDIFQSIAGSTPIPPFCRKCILHSFSLRCKKIANRLYIERDKLIYMFSAYDYNKNHDNPKFQREEDEIIFWDVREAEKAFRKCHDVEIKTLLRGLVDEKNSLARDISCTRNLNFFCHVPSSMVNVTQFLNALGSAYASDFYRSLGNFSSLEVCGVPEFEGSYVDRNTFKKLNDYCCQNLGLNLRDGQSFRNPMKEKSLEANQILCDRFRNVNSSAYILLVTRQLNPSMVLIRRSDHAVNSRQLSGDYDAWEKPESSADFIPPEEAFKVCGSETLSNLEAALRTLKSPISLFPSRPVYQNSATDEESVTSIAPSINPLRFTGRKPQQFNDTAQSTSTDNDLPRSPSIQPTVFQKQDSISVNKWLEAIGTGRAAKRSHGYLAS